MPKIDAREVYEDKVERSGWCECNADKACNVCIDDELYGTVTTTRQGNSEEAALHALIHCENEQACKFCNPQMPPPPPVIYAHGYMDDEQAAYYEGAK
jgi:hypothetical protein